ncbi:hypothetical protein H2199_006255 [Coniosporium tulheliwenetii]|uniref:Uncharacterized protein n=1 Tax=Coniosporium tulheliwenetii TaxID=3383036 RepID=A0ACC2YX63_9PEZI|nr:hypothetical protein H2199_006255 [Cladosporium sp. JES 115]
MATEVQQPGTGEPRFSRYRSVRKAQQQQQLPEVPAPAGQEPVETVQNCPVSRKQRRTAACKPPDTASRPQKITQIVADNDGKSSPKTPRDEARELIANEAERQKRVQAKLKEEKRAKHEAEEPARRQAQQEQEDAQRRREQEESEKAERLRLDQEMERAAKARARQSEERRRRAEEQQRVADQAERQRQELQKAAQSQAPREIIATAPEPAVVEPQWYCGLNKLFKRREVEESSPSRGMPSKTTISGEGSPPSRPVKPSVGGAAPGIDAPISAVNAGDRRVLVECNRSSVLLPVTPTTTALDLIRSASTCLSEPIDPRASVLLESFGKVGVQRPLRNYEHVRDVLNSWDDDRQNSLVVVESATGGNDKDLSASHVSEEKPAEYSCLVYYSQRPGKWDKRWITLRSDGQVLAAKNESGKDSTNICHISDFDIYTPTPRQIAKKIKPPKKICFAIKSQQKSSMFMTTTSYVHFFSTSDKQIGTAFYKAVQGWRSWYLVNVMGEGQKKPRPAASEPAVVRQLSGAHDVPPSGERTTSFSAARPGTSTSQDSHYQLGSFKPLLDISQFSQQPISDRRNSSNGHDDDPKALPARKPSTRSRNPPPVSYPTHASKNSNTSNRLNSIQSSHHSHSGPGEESAFAPTGLLGRTYSQRQKIQRDRDALAAKNASNPFTEGPSLLNTTITPNTIAPTTAFVARASTDDTRPTRMTSVRSTTRARDSSDLHRTTSAARREKPKPLVDLTPQYIEPPQFAKRGKGFKPEQLGPGGLIDCATSPEFAITVPPALDWRARPTTSSAGAQGHSGVVDRTRSLHGAGPGTKLQTLAANNHENVPENSADAFTGQGLLAHAGFSQGDAARGHGVMSGANARGRCWM